MADHAQHGEHVHGTMDIREQEKAYAGFIKLATWGATLAIVVLIFTALVNA